MFKAKEGYSITDALKKADNSIGVISEAVGTPTKNSLKDIEKLTSSEGLVNGNEVIIQGDQVHLRKSNKIEELRNPINRDSFEYIDKSEVDDANAVIWERPVEGGPMIASVEDIKDIDPDVDEDEMRVIRRTKPQLYVSDLSTKLRDPRKTKSVYQKSQLYLGVLFLVSIYYSLPVLQMVARLV